MNTLFHAKGTLHLGRVLCTSRQYHAGRGASVNTAIQRGIRKSKGLAFRSGSRGAKDPNDPRAKYVSGNLPVKYDLQQRAERRDESARNERPRNDRPARETGPKGYDREGRDPKIRRGIKVIKSNKEIDRKKPNPAGRRSSEGRFLFDSRERRESGFDGDAQSSRPSVGRDAGNSTESGGKKKWARISDREVAFAGYQQVKEMQKIKGESTSSTQYQSRNTSFGSDEKDSNRFSMQRRTPREENERPKFNERPRSSFGRRDDSKSGTSGWSPRSAERPSDRSSSDRTFRPRDDSNLGSGGDAGRFSMKRERFSGTAAMSIPPELATPGSSDIDASVSTPRITKHTMDDRFPLPIPYTTPSSEFLYGTSVVEAALTSRKAPTRQLYKLYIYTGENREKSSTDRDVDIAKLASRAGVKVSRMKSPDDLRMMDKMSGGRPHNGYVLEASPLPRLPITRLAEITNVDGVAGFKVTVDHQSKEDALVNGTNDFIKAPFTGPAAHPIVLFLDSVQDPGNLGGIIRTASFLGINAVAIATRNSASFTPVVLKASAGASENITLFSVSKPEVFIQESREAGWKIYAAVAPASGRDGYYSRKSVSTDRLGDPLVEGPCVLMLGGEGEGLRMNLRKKADVDVYIPGSAQRFTVDSLNVSVAAGILCSAFVKRRKGVVADAEAESEGDKQEVFSL